MTAGFNGSREGVSETEEFSGFISSSIPTSSVKTSVSSDINSESEESIPS